MITRNYAVVFVVFLAAIFAGPVGQAEEDWFDGLVEMRASVADDEKQPVPLPDFGKHPCTVSVWLRTKSNGSICAKTAEKGEWIRNGKSLFVQGGRVVLDIGWVGAVDGSTRVADGEWHHVALVAGDGYTIYVDGEEDAFGELERVEDPEGSVFKIGHTSSSFPVGGRAFRGAIDDVRVYARELSEEQIRHLADGEEPADGRLVGRWKADGDGTDASGGLNHADPIGEIEYGDGKFGKAFVFDGKARLIVPSVESPGANLWAELRSRYRNDKAVRQMGWERGDSIWGNDWKVVSWSEVAGRYAAAVSRPAKLDARAEALAKTAKTVEDVKKIREVYLKSRRYGALLDTAGDLGLEGLRGTIASLYGGEQTEAKRLLERLDALETQLAAWADEQPSDDDFDDWKQAAADLRRDVLFNENPLVDFDKLLFIKRYTYQSSHFYADYIDGCVNYGGNLCVLDLKTGEVTDLIPEMKEGIFDRFDLHFSAKKVAFNWKKAPKEGFRIYEIDIDPVKGVRTGGPRQLTFPPDDEAERIEKYAHPHHTPGPGPYYHQTDDMHPCYLPDGGIAFTSSRCEYGTLCDAPDILTTPVIYRMDGDGKHMEKLTNSPVSEFCPSMLSDGRILYTRWEYVDKGQLGVKCLWAMRPDGSASVEIYGNDIPFPPSFMYGRQIPGYSNKYVFVGAPHYPQGGSFGPIIRIDMRKDIRSRAPMTYITPDVDVRQEPGWNHKRNGRWVRDGKGPLYTDPYPLSESLFLVSYNPDRPWRDVSAYGLYLLDDKGNHELIYEDDEFTCREPFPLRTRNTPPVLPDLLDPNLAKRNLALCIVKHVHQGMTGIEKGEVKYLRVMEQIPRPWDSRRFWDPDSRYDRHTHLVSDHTALAAKAMWGVVPIEKDGSAYFYVPADRNVYFQALDKDYMELQRERTYVNYRPGETRSCVGCHETPEEVVKSTGNGGDATALALRKPPVMPGPQPGDDQARQVLHYPTYVQPVLDKHCVRCHGDGETKAGLDLTGELTTHFNRSYVNLMRRGMVKTFREDSDFGGTAYSPPKTIGSHAGKLMKQMRKGCTGMEHKLPRAAFVRLATWVDAAGVYYGSYWGRRNIKFKDHPYFRFVPTFEQAISTKCPVPMAKR